MKKWIKRISLILMTVIMLPGLIYLGLAVYYQDSFMYGTWINGIYCTGKTVSEAARDLTENFEYDVLYVITPQDVEVLEINALEMEYDFESALKEYRRKQNPYIWFFHMLTGHQSEVVIPKITFNESLLEQWMYTTDSFVSNLELEEDRLFITWGENGYEIVEEKEQILNTILTQEKISQAIKNADTEINLIEEGCYFTREETMEMQEIRDLYKKIEEIQSSSLTYKMKEKEKKVTPSEIALWIAKDAEGNFKLDKNGMLTFDRNKVTEFVDKLADEYDTWHNFPFVTHDGREIVLKKGNYGTQIDKKRETAYLMGYLKEPTELVREPFYAKDVLYKESNVIDNTYVEVDMTEQKMYFFSGGEKVLETNVVTGCTSKRMGTPEMVCYVNYKTRNVYLKGRYFVKYWVPVYGGIGLHDAMWRNKFGDEIYKNNGSHGCVNTPLEKMEELYSMLEVKMPVVIHY